MVKRHWLRKLFAASLGVIALALPAVFAEGLGDSAVIVYNAANPDSRPLAEYYAEKRGVPTNQICRIEVRDSETITRKEFNEKIRDPIAKFLTDHDLLQQEPQTVLDPEFGRVPGLGTVACKISYVVLMYGVPLRIDSDPTLLPASKENDRPEFRRNEAAVESELATLPTANLPSTGFLKNPFFGSHADFGPSLSRKMLLVGRLDGPDAQTARRLVDDALRVERYGLHGRAYFDWQGTHDKGYEQGDDWIRGAYNALFDAGYECAFDDKPAIFDVDYPMTDAAVYAGWYAPNIAGPFLRPEFKFKTGAIAYHLHSWSGSSVRTRTSYWVGPLLAKGAAATMGNVFEPYLSLTPHVDMFFKRLLSGATFLEAAYYSQPAVSWQTTFVGDPLYRPFVTSLDRQIERLEADHQPDLQWAFVRRINLLLAQGDSPPAIKLCRAKAEELSSRILYEKLGDILHHAHRDMEAVEAYDKAQNNPPDSYHHIRVATKMADTLEAAGKTSQALAIYEALGSGYATHHNAIEFTQKALALAIKLGDSAKARSLQATVDKWLAAQHKDTETREKK